MSLLRVLLLFVVDMSPFYMCLGFVVRVWVWFLLICLLAFLITSFCFSGW